MEFAPTEPPKITVITPYFGEPDEWLDRCIKSVKLQKIPTKHLLVAVGETREWVKDRVDSHIDVAKFNDGYGNVARTVGAISAFGAGADAVIWLDGDNWLEPDHVERNVATWLNNRSVIVTSPRILRRVDESMLGIDSESDGAQFNDANCYFIGRRGIGIIHNWALYPGHRQPGADRYFWQQTQRSGLAISRQPVPSVNYFTTYEDHYKLFGETPPKGAKPHRIVPGINHG